VRLRLAVTIVVLGSAVPAAGHQSSIVYSDIAPAGRNVRWTFQLADADLAPALGLGEKQTVDRATAQANEKRLLDYLAARVKVENGGSACEPEPHGVTFEQRGAGWFALAVIDFACKRTVADLTIQYDLFFDGDPRHQGFASVKLPAEDASQHVFRADKRTLSLSRPATLLDHVRDYLLLGIEHIFTGYDHLAFLFGLLVVAGFRRPREGLRCVIGVVTAFTVAHSITLVCSGLDLLRLPSRIVEPAIALSILWVAIENLLVEKPKRRWLLTFGFGLIHGFGFASVLREIGLPPRGLVLSLLSFNVGVELGQLAVVALVAPALHIFSRDRILSPATLLLAPLAAFAFLLLHHFGVPTLQLAVVLAAAPLALLVAVPRLGYYRAVRRGGSYILAALALFWLVERVANKTWLGGALG
jgi:hypothetical protein